MVSASAVQPDRMQADLLHARTVRQLAPLLIAAVVVLALPATAPGRSVEVPRRAAMVLQGEHRDDLAGASVARAGDVNGDGRGDVIVGAPLADARGRRDAGSAYVVFGGKQRGRVRLGELGPFGFRIDGAVSRPSTHRPTGAGATVTGAGDVNGDGLADVLVSGTTQPLYETGPRYSWSAAFVVFGKRDTTPVDLAELGTGGFVVHPVDHVVTAIEPAGDVNGDGRADVAVATAIEGDEGRGTVVIVFGKGDAGPVFPFADLGAVPWGFRVSGGAGGLRLGRVAPAGDVNGDGRGDLLLGAPGARQGRVGARGSVLGRGSVFVLHSPLAPVDPIFLRPGGLFDGFEVDGPRRRQGFGYAVARFGRGIIAGAPGAAIPPRGRGGAWIVPRRGARPIRLVGPRRGGPAGVAVDAPGDVAGGRRPDALVVMRGRSRGHAKVLLFSARGRLLVTYRRLRNDREVRIAAAGAGNVIGNRRNDLIFGSPGSNRAFVLASR